VDRKRALTDLFANNDPVATERPLADRMRPRTLDEFIGQEHLLAPGKPLRNQIERDEVSSMILWGPPGCGKTTLAQIIAQMTRSEFVPFSAVLSGIAEIRKVMERAERSREMGNRTIVFVDEVHRFNKAQQDAFLPWVERGSIVLIGATTENPSFEVIGPLLSRTKVYMLRGLDAEQLAALWQVIETERFAELPESVGRNLYVDQSWFRVWTRRRDGFHSVRIFVVPPDQLESAQARDELARGLRVLDALPGKRHPRRKP